MNNEYSGEEKYGFERIIQVPNEKQNLEHYVIGYDSSICEDDAIVVQYTLHVSNTK